LQGDALKGDYVIGRNSIVKMRKIFLNAMQKLHLKILLPKYLLKSEKMSLRY